MKSRIFFVIALFYMIFPCEIVAIKEKNFPFFNLELGSLGGFFGFNIDTSGAIKSLDSSINQNIKRLFIAATGLALVTTGCLVIKEQISKFSNPQPPIEIPVQLPQQPTEKPKYSLKDGLLTASGALLVTAGITAILLCDKFAQLFTAQGPKTIATVSGTMK